MTVVLPVLQRMTRALQKMARRPTRSSAEWVFEQNAQFFPRVATGHLAKNFIKMKILSYAKIASPKLMLLELKSFGEFQKKIIEMD